MKVLLINNIFYRKGGSEAVYFNTAELLKKHGHEVVFFSFKREENIACEQSEYFPELGGKVKQIKSYFYNTDAARQLEKLIIAEKPDVAHAHLFWGGMSPSIFKVLKKHNVPLVHTAHDYRMVCPGYTFKDGRGAACERCSRWNYYQCALHRCAKGSLVQSTLMSMEMYTRQMFHNPVKNISGFIFVSKFSEQKHIQHHQKYKDSNHIVLYNYTTPMLGADLSKKEDYFLFYGRLSFEKGIPTLLKVFAKHPELKLKVVGEGPLTTALRAEFECYENIQFLGYHSGGTLFELVRNAKFVSVPSECYENNPMTIVESYSLGTPVIGANIGGIPEIIQEGNTGLLFESGNVDALEQQVVKAASIQGEEYAAMSNAAYKFYQQNFSEEHHYEELMKFYEGVIGK